MSEHLACTDVVAALDDLVESVSHTPAWVERAQLTAIRVLADRPQANASEYLLALSALAGACPQVVDVDDDLTLTRAEWTKDSLLLTLRFAVPDASKRTMFRIEGAEPRVWYVTGIEGASCEFTQRSVNVWLPCVDGDLEFTTGSY